MLDTGALLALAHARDQYHTEAVQCRNEIARCRLPVYISLPTIYESHNRILQALGIPTAAAFLDNVYDGSVNILATEPRDEDRARELLRRYHWLDLTLTDAANMAVMERLGMAVVFSFDDHYWATGLIRIPPFHLDEHCNQR